MLEYDMMKGGYLNIGSRMPQIVEVLLGPKNDKKIAPLRGAFIFVNVEDIFLTTEFCSP